mmetsp:Transcript_8590/g.12893  ORF Transcript_8590/g.12893 Transcript_8590/m.12893 type:complete len:364 (+) Transcript_8590:119-1210(+)
MPMTPLAPPRSNPRSRSKSRTRSSAASAAAPSVNNPPPPPPPPPPLPFDPIIARVYGPTVNIYKDIFQVSSDASQEVLNEAYNRVWKEEQLKLDRVADDVALRKSIRLQIDATFAAYQILMNTEKRKKYDKAIGLVVEQPTFVTMTNQKREEYVKDLFEDDDDDDGKPSVAGKIEYVQPSLSITDFSTPMMQRKLPVVSPDFKVPPAEVHEFVQRFSLDEAFIIDGQADSPKAASIFDKSRIADSSPTEVSEFDVFRVANNVVDDDASYTSLHKPGRKKKSQRSRKSRKDIDARDRDFESDEDSFVQEESNIDACVDILQDSFAHEESNIGACVDVFGAMYLDGFPCVQSAHDDDEEESVLYG